ncbi:MAG: hypothetical protein ABFD79_08800 [Phycisphaerales bacterium]
MISKKRKIVYVGLFLIGFAAPFLFIDLFFLNGAIRGTINRIFFTPGIIKNNHFVSLDSSEDPDNERLKFMFAHHSKQGFYGLKRTTLTPEGEPIIFYLTSFNGDLSAFIDYTSVEHSPRKIITKEIVDVNSEAYVSKNPKNKSKSIIKVTLKSSDYKELIF